MPDEIMDSLKQAFMKDNKKISDQCPMADQIFRYAFEELSPEESRKAEEHLKSCRSCLDMYMDIRMAEEEAKNVKVKVLPGLQKAIDKGKTSPGSSRHKIGDVISDFFSKGFTFKPVAVFATLALFMFVGLYMFQSPTTNAPYSIQIMLYGKTQVGFRGGEPEYKQYQVESGGQMKSEDYFRFQTQIDNDAYVYIVFQDSSGSIESLEKGHITGGNDFFLPDGDKWYRLDRHTGTEKMYLLASKNPIKDFTKKIEDLKDNGIETIGKVFPEATIQSFSFEHK